MEVVREAQARVVYRVAVVYTAENRVSAADYERISNGLISRCICKQSRYKQ